MTTTPPLPASLDDADLVPWLVILDYGDMGPLDSSAWAKILGPAYAEKAAAVRALVSSKVREGVELTRADASASCECDGDGLGSAFIDWDKTDDAIVSRVMGAK